jgi:hypothetical protein
MLSSVLLGFREAMTSFVQPGSAGQIKVCVSLRARAKRSEDPVCVCGKKTLTLNVTRVIIRVAIMEVLVMQKKLTVTIDEEVYNGLRTVIGPRKISRFIEDLVRPHVVKKDMYAAYKEMAADRIRESEALERAEGTVGDLSDEEK